MSEERQATAWYPQFMDADSPETLYHYTSGSGLFGILNSKSIWASDCLFLNDKKELRQIEEVFGELKLKWEEEFSDHKFFEDFDHLANIIEDWKNLSTLIVSFSEEGDLLSQWRAYCPIDGGYSIGFKKEFWRRTKSTFSCRLFKCLYEKEDQSAAITDVIKPIVQEKIGLPVGLFELHYRGLRACIKHRSFKEEKEWRIVSLDPTNIIPGLSHRVTGNLIVPYYIMEFSDEELPISEIIVGPSKNPETAAMGVRQLLETSGQSHVEVKISECMLK